jgi:hypothetical protein
LSAVGLAGVGVVLPSALGGGQEAMAATPIRGPPAPADGPEAVTTTPSPGRTGDIDALTVVLDVVNAVPGLAVVLAGAAVLVAAVVLVARGPALLQLLRNWLAPWTARGVLVVAGVLLAGVTTVLGVDSGAATVAAQVMGALGSSAGASQSGLLTGIGLLPTALVDSGILQVTSRRVSEDRHQAQPRAPPSPFEGGASRLSGDAVDDRERAVLAHVLANSHVHDRRSSG